ncbi:epidermal growth factor-like protein 7 [Denticeps clupeoides]|uniref:epidermal growth factor-like protein 7 n=1 Tax=Denticeps clupeoides TaxID=299321 RepID=UPI0010A3401D|nr:epidermal growth factor-like protein 7 [Denticeps clupeoides]
MMTSLFLFSSLLILHLTCTLQFHGHHGRRVCGRDPDHRSLSYSTESYVQPAYKPYLTMCHGQRICSTYKTVYRVSYRQVSRAGPLSHYYPECCPGWQRFHSHNCNQAVCVQSCVNGGTCHKPNQCACPLGWTGRYCQTDIDECVERQPCNHQCVNTMGSYHCVCTEGFVLNADGRTCERPPPPATTPALPTLPSDQPKAAAGEALGLVENVTEEVQILRNRVELLEQKLEMVLAPFTTQFSLAGEEGVVKGGVEGTSFLSHSLQQLDRIESLSEQVGLLEERLGSCSCQEN